MLGKESTQSNVVTLAVERYEGPLVRYATSILGDIERARDVVQDTFLKLCKEEPGSVEPHLAPWLFTVCRNRAFDVRRKDSSMRPLTDIDLQVRAASGPRPVSTLEQQETVVEVLDAIAKLPEKEREAITLKFHCDLTYREISEVTDVSINYVGVLIHNGVKRIRRQMEAMSLAEPLVRRLS